MVAYDTDVSGTVQPTGATNNDESYKDAIAVLLTAMGGDAPAATTPLLWAGLYQDPTTGLYYMRARWYDPNTGEFLSVDAEFDQTLDAYRYADEDPAMQADPRGLMIQVAGAGAYGATCSISHSDCQTLRWRRPRAFPTNRPQATTKQAQAAAADVQAAASLYVAVENWSAAVRLRQSKQQRRSGDGTDGADVLCDGPRPGRGPSLPG